jgi:hypothetical protein
MPRVPFDFERRRPYLSPPFPDSEYESRIDRVLVEMQRAGLDALIVYANVSSYASVSVVERAGCGPRNKAAGRGSVARHSFCGSAIG